MNANLKIVAEATENIIFSFNSIKDVLNFSRVCTSFNRIINQHIGAAARESIEKMNKAFEARICFFCETPIFSRIATWGDEEISKYVTEIYKPKCISAINEIAKFCENEKFNATNLLKLRLKAQLKEFDINHNNQYLITKKLLIYWNLTKGVVLAMTIFFAAKELYFLLSLASLSLKSLRAHLLMVIFMVGFKGPIIFEIAGLLILIMMPIFFNF